MAATSVALGPQNGKILVRAYKEGLGAMAGHDLVLEATRWSGTATVDRDNVRMSSVQASFDLRSLEIVGNSGGIKPLSDGDRKDIRKNLEKSLSVDRYPEVQFRSSTVEPGGDTLRVTGDLSLAGATRPVTLDLKLDQSNGQDRITGTITVVQTNFGVKPYKAPLGVLKVKDAIMVDAEVTIPRD